MKNFDPSIIICLPMLALTACNGNLFSTDSPDALQGEDTLQHEMIVLGDRLEDPYSVSNITKALYSLYATRADRVVVEPTDYYIRFLPGSEEEYEALEDAELQLLDHPMDYEILREGDYYHDPEIPEGDITWQYAVVRKGEEYPEWITHEIIDECYIPEHSETTKADWIDWDEVEKEAFRLTGNGNLLSPDLKGDESGCPAGTITIRDSSLPAEEQVSGVKGVKVSCNSFVKFAHAYTDDDGNYKIDKKFNSNPRYRIVFKNKAGFAIGFNLLLQPASASTLGKQASTGVSVEVNSSSDRKLFSRCVVNNSAYEYFEKCRKDDSAINTPPSNLRIWLFQKLKTGSAVMLRQGVLLDKSKLGQYLGEYSFLLKIFLPDITLGLSGLDDYAGIYATTVHELAHASHFMQVGKDYWDTYADFIISSFISSGFVTYGSGTEENHGYCEVGEMWAYYLESQYYRERYSSPNAVFGTGYWFYPQIFLYLNERGLECDKIFPALTSDVIDRATLQKKLISLNPQFKSAIKQAFNRYN